MVSVITLTYKRKNLLEEAIESFLRQGCSECEMIVINDCEDIEYQFDHPNVKIVNIKERFPSVMDKLMYAFSLAKNYYMYRLDDDDLLAENALVKSIEAISENPGYDVYRSKGNYFFSNNVFVDKSGSVNNGNIYTKDYIDRIKEWPTKSYGEDHWLTYSNEAKIFEYEDISMIYRWGMNTYHISSYGDINNEKAFENVDNNTKEEGFHVLQPNFTKEYYEEIKNAERR